jgi:hypothetical protein
MASIAELLEAAAAANAEVVDAEAGPLGETSAGKRLRPCSTSCPWRNPSCAIRGRSIPVTSVSTSPTPGTALAARRSYFPTSGGNHLENEDRGLVDALMPKIAAGETSSRCASRASTATRWQRKDLHAAERLRRHDLWDAFLAEEFLPFVRAMAPAGKLTVYGRVDGRRITP